MYLIMSMYAYLCTQIQEKVCYIYICVCFILKYMLFDFFGCALNFYSQMKILNLTIRSNFFKVFVTKARILNQKEQLYSIYNNREYVTSLISVEVQPMMSSSNPDADLPSSL